MKSKLGSDEKSDYRNHLSYFSSLHKTVPLTIEKWGTLFTPWRVLKTFLPKNKTDRRCWRSLFFSRHPLKKSTFNMAWLSPFEKKVTYCSVRCNTSSCIGIIHRKKFYCKNKFIKNWSRWLGSRKYCDL